MIHDPTMAVTMIVVTIGPMFIFLAISIAVYLRDVKRNTRR